MDYFKKNKEKRIGFMSKSVFLESCIFGMFWSLDGVLFSEVLRYISADGSLFHVGFYVK